MRPALVGIALLLAGRAAADAPDLAPGVPELLAAESRLEALLGTSVATERATGRLQAAWTSRPAPKRACDDPERIALGWRIERFGSAWREAIQAARAQADRVRRIRAAATVAPLVDARWMERIDGRLAAADRGATALLEASAWEAAFVRPTLAACPVPPLANAPGIPMLETPVRDEPEPYIAVLAVGDGWVCPGAVRAEESVVLVPGHACWSASPTCGCTAEKVEPGAVLGPPVAEAPVEAVPSGAEVPVGAEAVAKPGPTKAAASKKAPANPAPPRKAPTP
ncbi:MAG: hypothetical protein Q8P41_10825 [Pseudomonadota bacterium]|nr:hypothetical protein [Pseudomonadota bacterium]